MGATASVKQESKEFYKMKDIDRIIECINNNIEPSQSFINLFQKINVSYDIKEIRSNFIHLMPFLNINSSFEQLLLVQSMYSNNIECVKYFKDKCVHISVFTTEQVKRLLNDKIFNILNEDIVINDWYEYMKVFKLSYYMNNFKYLVKDRIFNKEHHLKIVYMIDSYYMMKSFIEKAKDIDVIKFIIVTKISCRKYEYIPLIEDAELYHEVIFQKIYNNDKNFMVMLREKLDKLPIKHKLEKSCRMKMDLTMLSFLSKFSNSKEFIELNRKYLIENSTNEAKDLL